MNRYRTLIDKKASGKLTQAEEHELIDIATCICCLIINPEICKDCKWNSFLEIRQQEISKLS